uniref:CCHC-type domain-containing protein n=1 Tax=Tanacetum cinerariifolium TaxID=118510 RepID=A0A6L2M266_TANCI|nr:hypothetical protein [Tanacetum cinerariifolium]
MFHTKASKERLDVVKSLMACKPKPKASICAFVLEIKGYFDSLLQTAEQGIKKSEKGKATQGKSDRGSKRKVEYEIAPTSDLKEAVCFYCNTNGHWKRSCPKYMKDLKDGKVKKGGHSGSKGKQEVEAWRAQLKMTRNVISFHALFKDGYQFSFDNENRDILVYLNGCFMFKASPCKGIYETIECISNNGNVILNVGSSNELDKSKLWHSRLRHVNKKRIAQLQKDGVLESFDFKSDDVCESCLLGKMTKSPFTGTCERVFKMYQNEVENQLGRKIKLTPPRTPQLNGVAERRNKTLLDMVQSMMCQATLPINFWGYALETTAYILNLIPTKKGCEVFVTREAQDKLEARSEKCLFVGYPKESFGYLFYKPKDNVVFVARRRVFLEREMISKEETGSKIDFEEIQESADEEPIVNVRQKNTLTEYMILSGADNRPPMLDKDLTKKYAELSATEKIQVDCDMKATNIILQGLPADIYLLVNHHRVAKDLWERVQLLMQGDNLIACLNKAMAFLTVVASSRGDKSKVILVLVIKVMLLVLGETMQVNRKGLLTATTVKTEDLDTYDSDCDDISNAKAVLMANISNYGSTVISKEKANKEQNNESVTAELERYKKQVKTFKQRLNIDLSSREKMIDSQMDDMIKEKLAQKEQVDSLEQNLSKQIKENESLLQTFIVFKNESKEKENKYMENEIDLDKKINELDNIIFKVEIRSKMSKNEKDPEAIKQKISHKPNDYVKLNQLSEDFGKRFVPQQELSAKQAFWYHMSNLSTESTDASPVNMEAPKELPKVSLVNESLKKLKFHLPKFDNVVKIKTTLDARTEGEWGFEHTKVVFNNEIIVFLKSLKDIFNVFDKDLLKEIIEVQTVFDQMNVDVQQSPVDKQCLKIAKKELLLENDRLLQQIMSQDALLTMMNSMSLNVLCDYGSGWVRLPKFVCGSFLILVLQLVDSLGAIMSSITAQQAKLDLELVSKEKRLEIGKCNERLNPGKTQREPTFQVVLDALALTLCYSAFLITADVPEVYMHQFWDFVYKHDTFYKFKVDKRKRFKLTLEIFKDIFKICPRVQGQDFDALSTDEEIMSFLRELEVYLERQLVLTSFVYPEHKSFGIARKFKKASPSKKDLNLNLVPVDEEPKSTKIKVHAKKTARKQTSGVVIRDTHVESSSKRKEKVDVARGKGIELLSEVALTEEAQYEEVRKKSLRDFHKTRPSDSEHETGENESGSKFDQEENEEEIGFDEEEKEDNFIKTPSNDTDNEDKTNVDDIAEGDKDDKMDYTTSELYDDVDIRLNEPVHTDEGLIQKEGADAEMINVQQRNENLETTLDQVVEDAHVTINIVAKKTEVPITSSSHSSDLAAKFLNFADIPTTEAEIVSPMDVPFHHEAPSGQTPSLLTITVSFNNRVSALEKDVSELKKDDTLKTQVTALVDKHLDAILGATRDEFMSYLSASITARITEQTLLSTYDKVYSLKRSQKDKDKDEDPSAGSYQGLKKRKTSKDAEPTKGPKAKESQSGSSKGAQSQSKSSGKSVQSEELEFEVAYLDTPQDQEENPGPSFRLLKGTRSNYVELEYDFEECYKALSEKLDWDNPEGYAYPFDLTKPLPLVMNGNRQMVPFDYFFNNDLKYLDSGRSYAKTWVRVSERDWKQAHQSLGDDVSDFAIALRMFTRSMVIQRRVKDLQLGVESYQKKINVTKPETTRIGIRKKDPYTPYQDPQGFIYVDTVGRNMLIRSDELYKFNDGTLKRL